MWLTKLQIAYQQLCAKHLRVSKDAHTPILFDDYNTDDYYYILNNNNNLIYSVDEVYEILKEGWIEPFTRVPIKNYKFVKVSISK